jgi:prepilin-type N-terminal cleavage/methylation domain-containing protein/prepilin-type processing-associated H-X9-DG protein
MRKKSGFTLIELLVVVAIITVLIAMLLPALNQVREKTRELVCASQLRDIGLRFQSYLQEYNDTYPPAWYNNNIFTPWNSYSMRKYFIQGGSFTCDPILVCPTAAVMEEIAPAYFFYRREYAYNRGWGNGIGWIANNWPAVNTNSVTDPALTILMMDTQSPNGTWTIYFSVSDAGKDVTARHSGGANFLMADAHVQWYLPTDTDKRYLWNRSK